MYVLGRIVEFLQTDVIVRKRPHIVVEVCTYWGVLSGNATLLEMSIVPRSMLPWIICRGVKCSYAVSAGRNVLLLNPVLAIACVFVTLV